MRFTPKTENEVAASGLLEKGIYDFQIVSAEDKESKSGNEMIVLKVNVFDDEGRSTLIFDYLLETVAYKIRHAAYACGLGDKYEGGQLLAEDFIDKTGKVKVGISKDKTGQYPDKNSISDYVVDGSDAKKSDDMNDEIPWG